MKTVAVLVVMALAGSASAAPDWGQAPVRKMKLFYPGQAALEWVMNKPDHSAAPDITDKKRSCAKCHEGDANEIGDKIVKGQPVGSSKTVLEPNPVKGKAGFVPVSFQSVHDAEKIYFRFEWTSPPGGDKRLDAKNEVKLSMMFDGGGTVDGSNLNGCWATCHQDLRSMKIPKDDKKTKYIKDAELGSGKFMDLMQFRSGKDEKPVDGYVAATREMEGGKSLIKAEGKKEGNKWVVVLERSLAGTGKGDHSINAGKIYNFGFAIHEDFANARFHYVSLGYQFGLDQDVPGVKSHVNVIKQ